MAGGLGWMAFKGPFQAKAFCDSMIKLLPRFQTGLLRAFFLLCFFLTPPYTSGLRRGEHCPLPTPRGHRAQLPPAPQGRLVQTPTRVPACVGSSEPLACKEQRLDVKVLLPLCDRLSSFTAPCISRFPSVLPGW